MHARLRGSKSLITLIKPDFPSLADEIAKPHPDMNIKVATFTVSEKSSNTHLAALMLQLCVLLVGWNDTPVVGRMYDCSIALQMRRFFLAIT